MQPIEIKLVFRKSTKGTHVYDMVTANGVEMGSVYLPKLILPVDAPKALEMTVKLPA